MLRPEVSRRVQQGEGWFSQRREQSESQQTRVVTSNSSYINKIEHSERMPLEGGLYIQDHPPLSHSAHTVLHSS